MRVKGVRIAASTAVTLCALGLAAGAAYGQCGCEQYAENLLTPSLENDYSNEHLVYLNWVWNWGDTPVARKCAGAQHRDSKTSPYHFYGSWACTTTVRDVSHSYSGSVKLRGLARNSADTPKRLGAAVWW